MALSRSLLSLTCGLVTLSSVAMAQSLYPADAQSASPDIAIWQTGDEDTTVYMMGTVHFLKPGTQWKTEQFEQVWGEVDTVYFEIDQEDPTDLQQAIGLMQANAALPAGQTLSGFYTEEEREKINAALAEIGLSLTPLENMRPWYASMMIAQAAVASIGGDAESGIEAQLGAMAEAEGKETRRMETMVRQIRAMTSIEDEVFARSMTSDVDELTDTEEYFDKMVGMWITGEAEALGDFLSEAWEATPSIEEKLLHERNEEWADLLDQLIETEEGTFLIAVGAGHLAGDKDLQEYLTAEGYEVRRLP